MAFDRLPVWEPGTGRVYVVIDTPAGSANKYKFDDSLDAFRISRVLPAGLVFPGNFGSIYGTRAQDGDPLDVLVLGLPPAIPGCVITTRLLGILHARQVEGGKAISNDRLIGAGETAVNCSPLEQLSDLPPQQLRDIVSFFESYNAAQRRDFKITGRGGRRAAEAAVTRAIRAHQTSKRRASQGAKPHAG
jgi:inorganic pyrophosphatase